LYPVISEPPLSGAIQLIVIDDCDYDTTVGANGVAGIVPRIILTAVLRGLSPISLTADTLYEIVTPAGERFD